MTKNTNSPAETYRQVKTHKLVLRPVAALVMANVLWGINTPLSKIIADEFPIFEILTLRLGLAALVFLPFAYATWKKVTKAEFLHMAVGSMIGISAALVFTFLGLQRAASINAAIIFLLVPAIQYIISVEFLREKAKRQTLVGIIIAFFGALVVVLKPWLNGSEDFQVALTGNMLFLLAAFCIVIGTVLTKPVLRKISPVQVTFTKLALAPIPLAIAAVIHGADWEGVEVGASHAIAFVYAVVFASAAAYALFYYGLSKLPAEDVGVFEYLDPVVAVIAAAIILGERPDALYILGVGLVFVGLYVAETKLHWHDRLHHRVRH